MKTQRDLIWGTMFGKFSRLGYQHRQVLEGVLTAVDRGTIALGNGSFLVLWYLMLVPERWGGNEWLLVVWGVIEVVFHCYVRMKLAGMESGRAVPVFEGKDRIRLAKQTCEQMEDVTLDLSGWHKDGELIHFGHVEEWLVHMFFAKSHVDLTPQEFAQATEIIDMFHARMGLPERVEHEKGSMMVPSLQPIRYEMRSALFYASIWALKRMGRVALMYHGFTLCEFYGGIECWSNLPTRLETSLPPIIFFPGIGFGPMQYLDHLQQLRDRYPCRSIFVLSSAHTALSAAAEIATDSHVLAAVDRLMAEHGFDNFSLVGHSFGTLFAALVVNCRPNNVKHFTLIDPICFMFWEPSLMYNSQFAKPDSLLQYVAVRFITKDPLFAAAYSRLTYWPSISLFPENIPCPAAIYLSSKDWAIDPHRVQAYLLHRKEVSNLTHFNVQMLDAAHQEYMLIPEAYNQINDNI